MTQRAVAPPHSTPLLPLLLVVSLPLLANLLHGSLLPCVGAAPEVGGTPWATPALEALDEQRDAEILQSVINSMAQWKQKHTHKKYQREKRASESVVCYESVGCFRDAGPFSYLDMLPSPPEEVSTQFLLYSRHRPHGPALLVPFTNLTSVAYSTTSSFSSVSTSSSSSERRSGYVRPVRDSPLKDPNNNTSQSPSAQKVPSFSTSFSSPSSSDLVPSTAFSPSDWLQAGLNVSAPTKVIVHGFGSSCSNVWVFEMRSALMSVEECNVICVDWEAGATIPNYVRAAANTRLVGKQLALLLGRLRDSLGLDLQRVHLIGFSLGAHVAGFTGSELQNLSRITGLDPAGPLFENQDPAARLDSSDATFVDVVHSNGENLILGGLGSWQPMGHVDFYPNGGRMQKGCSNLFVGAVSDIFWSSSESHGRSLCNHRRAYKFFTDSVSPRCHFPAIPCESYEKFLDGECFPCSSQNRCGNMGYYADRSNGRGTLFLITRDEEPFCAHQYLVKVESTPSALPVISYGRIQITILGSVPEANETFTLTHKDDEELKAGGSLSRIIVPHPVMEEPIKVEVLYKAYSGWISSGLTRWSIDKVTIGDSFGKSASFCNKGLILESNVPVMLPLYPGDCNPPIEAPTYSPSVPIPRPPIPTPPNAQLDISDSRPSQDKWPQTANDNEVKSPNKVDGSSTINNQETTRIPTQVVYVGDEGLEPIKEETPEKNDEKRNENKTPDAKGEWEVRKNTSKSEALMGGIGAGQEDPLLSPQIHSINDGSSDETDSSWQPLTNDGSSNSLSPDGPGSREDGARAFVDPGEAKNNIEKRNDSLQASPKDAEADKQSSQSKRSPSPVLHSHWRPRHIPIYGSSLYEPRGGWHPEMSPPELDPPPIHAPLTWQHWVGYENEFLKVSRELPSSTSKNVNVSDSTTISTSTVKLMPTPTPTNSTATTTEASGGPFAPVVETVQLLPQRLAAFLARAEEYARVTLSGMVLGVAGGTSPTGSASSMGNDSSDAARRKPKYFPPMSSSGISSSKEQTLAINAPAKSYPSEAQTAPIAVPSQPTSVSAMGRGLPQYYPRAIVGRGSEHTLDVKSGGSIPNYAGREKGSQETKSSQSGSFGVSEMSEPMLGDAPQPVELRKSEMSSIQSVVRPQRGISTSATERMLDMSVRGKGGIMQHWQKLDTVDSHHQPRYIPLRRSSMSQENPRAAPRRNPPPPAFVMPRKR